MLPAVLHCEPATVTREVQSRLRQFGVHATVTYADIFPTDPATGNATWRPKVTGAKLELSAPTDLCAAVGLVREALAPAPMGRIEGWLAELDVLTARRGGSATEAGLLLSAYAGRLRNYPGDIVRDVLAAWPGKWFPTWAELQDVLDRAAAPRVVLHRALVARASGANKRYVAMAPQTEYDWLQRDAAFARRRGDQVLASSLEDKAREVFKTLKEIEEDSKGQAE
jgi:hypothetical protein